ncbi:VATH-like protein [Mya arenaria]|uniref:VATH-like protein n=1 Tax=Mya arenaria TaxID=6604 RepID=A0ABY7FAL2_MYAAR|nr:VATH-like protein [Mya arenaria]
MAAQGNIDVKFNIDDIEKGAQVATSLLQQRANDVRNNRVNWQSYLQGQMISNEDFGFISKFDNANTEQRHQMLQEMPGKMQEDKSRVEILKQFSRKNKESVWTPFLHLLDRNDRFIVNQTSRIVAKIACWGKEWMESNDLKFYLNWLKDQLILPGNEYLQTAARCLQMMLRVDQYRFMFVQYQLIFCLWCLTFNPVLLERMNKQHSIIPILADILSDTVLKQLELLDSRKYDDPDIVEDLAFLQEKLQESVQDLSSFDEYVTEIKSGRLEWSPVHKSDRFWRENAIRLNEKNYELLKILVRLLEGSRDPLILSVAAHDIGEYVRYYPRGKNVIEQLGAKHLVMQYLTHEDPNVRYEALIAVQKLMVHNWEYLGKQISQASQDDTPGAIAAKS